MGGLPRRQALGRPALRFRKDVRIGERGEGGDEKATLRGLDDAGIAVVDGAVEQGSRPGPGLALVVGSHQLDPAEGTDVCLTPAGTDEEELSAAASGQRRPATVQVR